jgi:hypothetical protein
MSQSRRWRRPGGPLVSVPCMYWLKVSVPESETESVALVAAMLCDSVSVWANVEELALRRLRPSDRARHSNAKRRMPTAKRLSSMRWYPDGRCRLCVGDCGRRPHGYDFLHCGTGSGARVKDVVPGTKKIET